MPKIYINYPTGAFSKEALDSLAADITTAGLECEKLSDTPFVRSNIWVYANEYAAEKVYHGGKPRRILSPASRTPSGSMQV